MPNRKKHASIGSVSGAATATTYAFAKEQRLEHILTYGIGGLIGGGFGSCIADKVDLPTSPNHRSVGHSIILNLLFYFGKEIKRAFSDCLKWLELKAIEFEKTAKTFWAFCCRFLAGVLIGLAAGHGVHLLADAATPKSLPMLF